MINIIGLTMVINNTAMKICRGLLGIGIFLASVFFALILFIGPIGSLASDGPVIGSFWLYGGMGYAVALVVCGFVSLIGGFMSSWSPYVFAPSGVLIFLVLMRILN